jgi:hypothetical protein
LIPVFSDESTFYLTSQITDITVHIKGGSGVKGKNPEDSPANEWPANLGVQQKGMERGSEVRDTTDT